MQPSFGEVHQPDPHDFSALTRPKSNTALKVLVVLCSLALVGILVLCGGGIWLMNFGGDILSAEIETQLRDHPQIREHVGEIQSLDINWTRSLANEEEEVFVFDVEGTEAKGEITIESVTNDEGNEEVVWARLRLSSGETIELDLEQPLEQPIEQPPSN